MTVSLSKANSIRVRETHLSSDEAYSCALDSLEELRPSYGTDTAVRISPAAAVTIAAMWQSSAGTGVVLAAFASGCEVDRTELIEDAERTIEVWADNELDRTVLRSLIRFVELHKMIPQLHGKVRNTKGRIGTVTAIESEMIQVEWSSGVFGWFTRDTSLLTPESEKNS